MLPVVEPHKEVRLHGAEIRVLDPGRQLIVVIQHRRGRIAVVEDRLGHVQVVYVGPQLNPFLLDGKLRNFPDLTAQFPETVNILLGIDDHFLYLPF